MAYYDELSHPRLCKYLKNSVAYSHIISAKMRVMTISNFFFFFQINIGLLHLLSTRHQKETTWKNSSKKITKNKNTEQYKSKKNKRNKILVEKTFFETMETSFKKKIITVIFFFCFDIDLAHLCFEDNNISISGYKSK